MTRRAREFVGDYTETEPFIGVHEAAQITGYSARWIRELCRRNQIPHHQVRAGAELRFYASELRVWLLGPVEDGEPGDAA